MSMLCATGHHRGTELSKKSQTTAKRWSPFFSRWLGALYGTASEGCGGEAEGGTKRWFRESSDPLGCRESGVEAVNVQSAGGAVVSRSLRGDHLVVARLALVVPLAFLAVGFFAAAAAGALLLFAPDFGSVPAVCEACWVVRLIVVRLSCEHPWVVQEKGRRYLIVDDRFVSCTDSGGLMGRQVEDGACSVGLFPGVHL